MLSGNSFRPFTIHFYSCDDLFLLCSSALLANFRLQDFEILGWYPARPVLSWGEGASLALVSHPSSDGVTIKMPYRADVLNRPASHPIFSYWLGCN